MRIPKRPPSMEKLLEKIGHQPNRFEAILRASALAIHNDRYLHWDKLKYYDPPEGLNHEEWWVTLKILRSRIASEIPLYDMEGKSFTYSLPAPVPEDIHHIDQDAAGRIEMSEQQIFNTSIRDRYIVRSLIEEAITSSQLEGATTTRKVAKDMIRTQRKPRDSSERMILNNYRAMQRIRELKDRPLTEKLLLELHTIITDKTLKDLSTEGRFRQHGEEVNVYDMENNVLHTPPPAKELPKRIAAILDFANGKTPEGFLHPVIRAIILHFWLAYLHPFVDGNGRCARALFYWSMSRQGYWLSEFLSISSIIRNAHSKYGMAFLYTETDDNDLTYFILYHLKIIRQAIDKLHESIARKTAQIRQLEQLIKSTAGFNYRQMTLLSHALRHVDAEYTVKSHQTCHNIVQQTARVDLYNLAERGLLSRKKFGATLVFLPVKDLDQKLKQLK